MGPPTMPDPKESLKFVKIGLFAFGARTDASSGAGEVAPVAS